MFVFIMCQAIPREVKRVEKGVVFVDVEGSDIEAKTLESDIKQGDFVLLMGNLIVRKLTNEEAREIIDAREGR